MSRAKDIEHRKRLEPFGNIAAMLEVRAQKHIESLSDVELAQMAESVNWSTSTNC